jgi:hypothetical protein
MTLPKCSFGSTTLLLVTALALTAGCAASRREAYLQEKATGYVYRKPISEVWPQVKELLVEEGYSPMEAKGGYEMTTDYMMEGAPSSLGTSYARDLVRGIEKGPGQCTVEFIKQSRVESKGAHDTNTGADAEAAASNSTNRDPAMEWKLLQKVDPETAKAWASEAEQKVQ